MTLEDVTGIYAAHPDGAIVRLHSGDLSLYSALQEQVDWCVANDRQFEIVPGVGSLAAASALVGRELTVPRVAQSLIATRLPGRTVASMPARETVAAFAGHGTTMAVYLSAARPEQLQAELLAGGDGYGPQTPAAIVIRAVVARRAGDRHHRGRVGRRAARRRHPRHRAGPRRAGPRRCRTPVPPLRPHLRPWTPPSIDAGHHGRSAAMTTSRRARRRRTRRPGSAHPAGRARAGAGHGGGHRRLGGRPGRRVRGERPHRRGRRRRDRGGDAARGHR